MTGTWKFLCHVLWHVKHYKFHLNVSMTNGDKELWLDRWLAWLKLRDKAYVGHEFRRQVSVLHLQFLFPFTL